MIEDDTGRDLLSFLSSDLQRLIVSTYPQIALLFGNISLDLPLANLLIEQVLWWKRLFSAEDKDPDIHILGGDDLRLAVAVILLTLKAYVAVENRAGKETWYDDYSVALATKGKSARAQEEFINDLKSVLDVVLADLDDFPEVCALLISDEWTCVWQYLGLTLAYTYIDDSDKVDHITIMSGWKPDLRL